MLAHQQNARLDVMMDECVTGQPGAWHVLPSAEPHSCIGWAHRNLVPPLSDLGMCADRLVTPDPNAPERFARRSRRSAGIFS
jgi:glucosamine-6-phosphate deaminase